MPVARPAPSDARVIAHVDMDCFYVQVEQRKRPELKGLPAAVVQYNSWKGGGLIAVGYEARKFGVKRSMRGDEAKKVCPEINLVQVPVARGKADLNIYRDAGSEVVSILSRRGRCERASIDEVYLDLTDAAETMLSESPPEILEEIDVEALKSHVLGLDEDENDEHENVRKWLSRNYGDHRDKLLACAAIIVAELRMQVLKETEFTCSAGIAHNKMLAKLASAMNKPAQQTIVPFAAVKELLASLPIKKMKQLGGKLGSALQNDLGVSTVGDLLQFSEEKLQEHYGINTGTWLWNIARGISGDEVQGRLLPKSHGCGKTFPGPQALKTIPSVERWLNDLSEELSERIQNDLDQNRRIAHTLTLHARAYKTNDSDSQRNFPSRSCPLSYGTAKIQEDSLKLFYSALRDFLGANGAQTQANQNNTWRVTSLSITASKILATPSGTCSILKYFNGLERACSSPNNTSNAIIQQTALLSQGKESLPAHNRAELSKASDRDEQDTEISNNKDTCLISGNFCSSKCSLSEQERDGINEDIVPFCPSVHENSSAWNEDNQNYKPSNTETRINSARPGIRPNGQKHGPVNEKGACSILKFFPMRGPSCSSSQNVDDRMVNDVALLSSGIASCSGLNSNGDTRIENAAGSSRDEQRSETWNFNVEEIDPSVIDELPPEIQEEIRGWLRPLKRSKIANKGSSIVHYFSPVKKT